MCVLCLLFSGWWGSGMLILIAWCILVTVTVTLGFAVYLRLHLPAITKVGCNCGRPVLKAHAVHTHIMLRGLWASSTRTRMGEAEERESSGALVACQLQAHCIVNLSELLAAGVQCRRCKPGTLMCRSGSWLQ